MTWKDTSRFWNKFSEKNGCWVWTNSENGKGYGSFWLNGKLRLSHRVSYELAYGRIPKNKVLDHICRNRKCINPEHLRCVTTRQNVLENSNSNASKNTKKTHCFRDHPLSGTNLKQRRKGRECRLCAQIYMKKYGKEYWKTYKRPK